MLCSARGYISPWLESLAVGGRTWLERTGDYEFSLSRYAQEPEGRVSDEEESLAVVGRVPPFSKRFDRIACEHGIEIGPLIMDALDLLAREHPRPGQ